MKIINGSGYEISRHKIHATNLAERCFNAYKTVGVSGRSNDDRASLIIYNNAIRDFYWNEGRAKKGDAGCQLALFYMYRYGNGTEVNLFKSVFWLKQSAAGGNAAAMFLLGQVYLEGLVEEVDYLESRYWMKKAAFFDCSEAMLYIGFFAERGACGSVDYKEAFKWYLKASKLDNKQAHIKFAQLVFKQFADNEKYVNKAVYFLKKSIKMGNNEALCILGMYYRNAGERFSKNAFELLKKSADMCGDILAALTVAEMYETGDGTEKDADKALEYYNLVLSLI